MKRDFAGSAARGIVAVCHVRRAAVNDRSSRNPTEDEIAAETDAIVHRDAKDATQTVQATDAILIDTTYLTQEDQVERIVALAKAVTRRPDKTSAVDE